MKQIASIAQSDSLIGELLQDVTLDAKAMASMNFARLEHQRLERLIRTIVIPMIPGGYSSELGEALDRHLEQVRTFSRNFCWPHRHLGIAHGVIGGGRP